VSRISLVFLLTLFQSTVYSQSIIDQQGALVRSDTSKNTVYLCFTGHEYAEGFEHVLDVLEKHEVNGSFFFTGDFVRLYRSLVKKIAKRGNFVGAHSDKHLLYCDWTYRDSLLHSENHIKEDISNNLKALEKLELRPTYFMPPYEWYNKKVVELAAQLGQITVNFTSGTRSNADYTTPDMPNYIDSNTILQSIFDYLSQNNMNGFHLLIHPGTSPQRKDKFYLKLDLLITELKMRGYQFSRF